MQRSYLYIFHTISNVKRAPQQYCRYPFAIIYQEYSCIAADACGSPASSSSSLNPRVALNLPRLNFASSSLPPPHPRESLNYYNPRGLRHFQGILTITDGTGGSHTRRLRKAAAAHRHAAATLFSNPPSFRAITITTITVFLSCCFLRTAYIRAQWHA